MNETMCGEFDPAKFVRNMWFFDIEGLRAWLSKTVNERDKYALFSMSVPDSDVIHVDAYISNANRPTEGVVTRSLHENGCFQYFVPSMKATFIDRQVASGSLREIADFVRPNAPADCPSAVQDGDPSDRH